MTLGVQRRWIVRSVLWGVFLLVVASNPTYSTMSRGERVAAATGTWLATLLGAYALVYAIRWVYRGFRGNAPATRH
jgi:hypothetical protein